MRKKKKPGLPPGLRRLLFMQALSEYEVGRCSMAIEAISNLGKPIVEVGGRRASVKALTSDLRKVLKLHRIKGDRIEAWVKKTKDGYCRYGFYREPWALKALEFLDKAELSDYDRTWVSGLVFGYVASEIQQFIDKKKIKRPLPTIVR